MLRHSFCIFFNTFFGNPVDTSVCISLYIEICMNVSVRLENASLAIEVRRHGFRRGDQGLRTHPEQDIHL